MLPNLASNDNESGQERPSLPSIRDLFGEHLSKPINKRPSPFSLMDLGSSLPSSSSSPADSPGSILSSTMTSPRSAWSQISSHQNTGHAGVESYAPTRCRLDSSSQLFTTPSTSSRQDSYTTLPPINPIYFQSHRDTGRRTSSPYITTSSRHVSNSHSRSRSTSEVAIVVARGSLRSDTSLDPSSKRRHTIGSSRSSTSMWHPYPMDPHAGGASSGFPRNSTHSSPPFASRPPVTNPYPAASTHPSLTRNLPPVVGYPSPSSNPPSPPSTSGEEVSTERTKTLAKYECQYCKKRFNRPSSLKLHHNTHTGEKPFACPFPDCGRRFSVMSNMRRHARIHGEPSNRTPRDSSVEDSIEVSTVYSSSSSTHNKPIIPQAAIIPSSDQYAGSHSSSATSSPHTRSPSRLELLRHPSLTRPRPYPYKRSQSPLSDRGGSSPEW